MLLLAILFLVTAVLYSSVGFGGGSTYLALLLIWGIPYFIFPVVQSSTFLRIPCARAVAVAGVLGSINVSRATRDGKLDSILKIHAFHKRVP